MTESVINFTAFSLILSNKSISACIIFAASAIEGRMLKTIWTANGLEFSLRHKKCSNRYGWVNTGQAPAFCKLTDVLYKDVLVYK